jgi:hypothetical protein
VEVDHVTVFRRVQRFTPLLADAARLCRHSPGDRWHVDETYVRVNGVWRYVYRAVDQYGQAAATQQGPRDYLDRCTTHGLTRGEAIRCLKRYIAREIFTLIRRLNPITGCPQTA